MAYQGNNSGGKNRPNNNGQNNAGGKYPNPNKNNYEQVIEPPKITLDYQIQEQLFGSLAKKWSEQIEKESNRTSNKINQIRSFYDKVMELNEKAQNMTSDEQYRKEVFPFVIMLNSKVAYAKTRSLVSETFVKMMNQCVEKAITVEKMNNFKLFFEAVIGFYPKK